MKKVFKKIVKKIEKSARRYRDRKLIEIVKMVEKQYDDCKNIVLIFQTSMFTKDGKVCYNGGAERYCQDLATILKNRGYKTILIQLSEKQFGIWCRTLNNLTVFGIPVSMEEYKRAIRYFTNYNFVIYSGLNQLFPYHKLHPNIVISHGICFDNHSLYFSSELLEKELMLIEKADNIVSVDTNTISFFRTIAPAEMVKKHFIYIPNYADTTKYVPNKNDDKKPIQITIPRRMEKARGYNLVKVVIPKILKKYNNVQFNFVGFIHDKKIELDLQDKMKEFSGKITHKVCEPDEMIKVYQNADISIIPTLFSEGTSLSCIEAMSCGNCIISTNVGGLPNLIIDNYNGLLINPDANELLEALEKVINNKDLRERLSRNAIEVSKEFDKSKWIERWNNVISNVEEKIKFEQSGLKEEVKKTNNIVKQIIKLIKAIVKENNK